MKILKPFLALLALLAGAFASVQAQDTTPPVIQHTKPAEPVLVPVDSITFEATITDESAIVDTPFFYRVATETTFHSTSLQNAGGSLFSVTLPGPQAASSDWEYYFEAEDSQGNRSNLGTAQDPFTLSFQYVPPTIELSQTTLSKTIEMGANAPNEIFTVRNSGRGTLNYTVSETSTWLSVSPAAGSSTGEADTITVSFDAGNLSPGNYTARITVSAPEATNSPQYIAVSLEVLFPTAPDLLRSYGFDQDAEGWSYVASTVFREPFTMVNPGYLGLASDDDNDETYGYFVSPANALEMLPFDPMADSTQTGALWERQGPHYLLRYWVRRAVADRNLAPTLRLRANSKNFESYHSLIMPSVNDASGIPDIYESQPIDLLIHPHPLMYEQAAQDRTYYVSADIINADQTSTPGGDAINGGYLIDRVEIYVVPLESIEYVAPVKDWDFETATQFDDWQFFTYSQFVAPDSATGSGALQMSAPDPDGAHGNWQNLPGTLTADLTGQSGALFVRARARLGADEPSGYKVPEQRLRIMPTDFTTVAETGILDISSATFVPRLNEDRYVYSYLPVPAKAAGGSLDMHAAWDLLSFEAFATPSDRILFETSDKTIYLQDLQVDLIRIQNYPPANP
ncbi:MAG: hypothetical protein PWP23_1282 [Candidatus Sumerlaeota bacterium]|nr:hypothetical protein [Candidatus Sumerlaeota bacterium]